MDSDPNSARAVSGCTQVVTDGNCKTERDEVTRWTER
jgi:hypothetical protein